MSDDNILNDSPVLTCPDGAGDTRSPRLSACRLWISFGLKIVIMIGGLGTALWFGLPESQNSAEQALTGFSPSNQVDTQRTQESGAPLARVRLPGILDLNHSTVEELQQLPGIGPVLAARIVRRRMQQGPFERVEDLLAVEGIGQRRLAQLADRIAVFPSTH